MVYLECRRPDGEGKGDTHTQTPTYGRREEGKERNPEFRSAHREEAAGNAVGRAFTQAPRYLPGQS